MPEQISLIAMVVLVITTLFLLLSQNWRLNIIALAVQFLAVFALTTLVWPFGLSAVKLVAGWMAGAVLGASQPDPALVEDPQAVGGATFIFRLLVAVLVWVLVLTITPLITSILPLPFPLITGAMLLIGMGLIHLGMTTRPLRVLLGLLTTLSGFELLYAAVENSVMVAGLLAVVTLGLALVGAYLLDAQTNEPVSEAAGSPGEGTS